MGRVAAAAVTIVAMVATVVALAVVAAVVAVVVALAVTAVVAPAVVVVVALAVAAVVDLAVVDVEVKDGVEVVLAIPEEAVPEVGCVGAPRGGFSMGPIESSGNCSTGPFGITRTAVGQVPGSAL